jgi:hypothetical protein
MQRTVGRWQIDHDPELTRRCFAQVPVGSGCDCAYCRNFNVGASQFLPADFQLLAAALGVDVAKPAELLHYCRNESGLYLTGGWFHLVGSIVSGADMVQDSKECSFERLVPGFEIGFTAKVALVPEAFRSYPLIQLEFQTGVPWILAEPEPE